MKEKILLFFCLISSFASSQDYHFDYFVKEKSEYQSSKKSNWSKEWFYDTKTNTKLNLEGENRKVIGVLYSKDFKLKHIFKVENIGQQINFIYKHSRNINQENEPEIPYKGKEVFEIKKLDSLKYSFVVFKDSKRRKIIIDAIINLQIDDFEYIDFRIDHIITREAEKQLRKLLNQNSKYIIKSIEYKYNSKFSTLNSLESINKVDLTLKVPDVLKEPKHWSDFEE